MTAEHQRIAFAGQIDLFFAFGQRQERGRIDLLIAECGQGSVQLAFATIDQQEIGKGRLLVVQATKPSRDNFVNRAKIVDTLHALDAIASISGLERQSIDKLHEAGYRFVATQVRNVNAFDHARRFGQLQDFLQAC